MPFPLAPLAVAALKYGAVGLAAYAAHRGLRRIVAPGRTDQRAEDALDALPDGVAGHVPRDRDQRNASARFRRRVSAFGQEWEVDAGLIARWRLRRL